MPSVILIQLLKTVLNSDKKTLSIKMLNIKTYQIIHFTKYTDV